MDEKRRGKSARIFIDGVSAQTTRGVLEDVVSAAMALRWVHCGIDDFHSTEGSDLEDFVEAMLKPLLDVGLIAISDGHGL